MRSILYTVIFAGVILLDYYTEGDLNVTSAWIIPAITAVGGLVGAIQRSRASNLEADNPYPEASLNPYLLQNLAQAQQGAQVGLPAPVYNLAQQGLNRNLAGVLRATERQRGYGVNLPSILAQANQSQAGLDAQNAAAMQQNQRVLMNARQQVAGDNQRVFENNELNRYGAMSARIAALRQAGNQNIIGAAGLLGQFGLLGGNFNNIFGGTPQQPGLGLGQSLNYSLGSGFGVAPYLGQRA